MTLRGILTRMPGGISGALHRLLWRARSDTILPAMQKIIDPPSLPGPHTHRWPGGRGHAQGGGRIRGIDRQTGGRHPIPDRTEDTHLPSVLRVLLLPGHLLHLGQAWRPKAMKLFSSFRTKLMCTRLTFCVDNHHGNMHGGLCTDDPMTPPPTAKTFWHDLAAGRRRRARRGWLRRRRT